MEIGWLMVNAPDRRMVCYALSKGSPQSPQITFTSRVARIMVPQQGQTYLILRLMDFVLPPLEPPSICRRLAWIPASPKVALIQASASGASVVTVQPYFACFSICLSLIHISEPTRPY